MTAAHHQYLDLPPGHSLRRIAMKSGDYPGGDVDTYTYQQLDERLSAVALWEVDELVEEKPPHRQSRDKRRLEPPAADGGVRREGALRRKG